MVSPKEIATLFETIVRLSALELKALNIFLALRTLRGDKKPFRVDQAKLDSRHFYKKRCERRAARRSDNPDWRSKPPSEVKVGPLAQPTVLKEQQLEVKPQVVEVKPRPPVEVKPQLPSEGQDLPAPSLEKAKKRKRKKVKPSTAAAVSLAPLMELPVVPEKPSVKAKPSGPTPPKAEFQTLDIPYYQVKPEYVGIYSPLPCSTEENRLAWVTLGEIERKLRPSETLSMAVERIYDFKSIYIGNKVLGAPRDPQKRFAQDQGYLDFLSRGLAAREKRLRVTRKSS